MEAPSVRWRAVPRTILYGVFKLGMWWAEAVGEWMVRFADHHRRNIEHRHLAAGIVRSGVLLLWLLSRISFNAAYYPTVLLGRRLAHDTGGS